MNENFDSTDKNLVIVSIDLERAFVTKKIDC